MGGRHAGARLRRQQHRLGDDRGFDHIAYHVLSVDEEARIVDVLFKFAARERIVLHRHMADYKTFVVQGELRLYRPNGELKEVRPTGSYVSGAAGGEPHTEGGGDCDAIVYFTNRNVDGPIYEVLGADGEIVTTFGIPEFRELLEAQRRPAPTRITSDQDRVAWNTRIRIS